MPRPGIGMTPTEFYVDRYDIFRIDVFEITTIADIMEARCQLIITNDCTGALEEVYDGIVQYRVNEKVTEKLVQSYEEFTRTRLLTVP